MCFVCIFLNHSAPPVYWNHEVISTHPLFIYTLMYVCENVQHVLYVCMYVYNIQKLYRYIYIYMHINRHICIYIYVCIYIVLSNKVKYRPVQREGTGFCSIALNVYYWYYFNEVELHRVNKFVYRADRPGKSNRRHGG